MGTSEHIQSALSLLGLSYPFAPEDVKKRYRALAKQWHPDANRTDPNATERFQELGAVMELLTGMDAPHLSTYTGIRYGQEIGRSEIEVDGIRFTTSISYVVSEIHAAD